MLKKTLAWGLWAVNIVAILLFWGQLGMPQLLSGDIGAILHATARLLGLLATFCALTQFVLMSRAGWLEPIFGLDRLAIFHRRNGVATISFMLAHGALIIAAYSLQNSIDVVQAGSFLLGAFYIQLALAAVVLFVLTVGMSIYIVRKHLKFETWYGVHILNYAAIALVPFHQLTFGSDFLANPIFTYYWIALYILTAVIMVVWRFGLPIARSLFFDFTVQKVVAETATANSIYITGRHLKKFRALGGQFVLVRFFDKHLVWQEHPFSLSMLPSPEYLRLTIRALGDFTKAVPAIKPGTKVWVSGPYGAFTHHLQRQEKVLYIAGGIGITPIRAMIEERANLNKPSDAVLLYGNRSEPDTVFLAELQKLAAKINMPIHNVLSEQKSYSGETGYIDKQKIVRLVPDVTTRDIFLCGPPPMMWGIISALQELGVPKENIHYERFALHKD